MCLNPCSNGIDFDLYMYLLCNEQVNCLNPCSNGIDLDLIINSIYIYESGLNPCSNGIDLDRVYNPFVSVD